jgi:hypothetical protein
LELRWGEVLRKEFAGVFKEENVKALIEEGRM